MLHTLTNYFVTNLFFTWCPDDCAYRKLPADTTETADNRWNRGWLKNAHELQLPGGGYSGYVLVGVYPGTPKTGGLRCGYSPKRGVICAGTTRKRGVLGTSTRRKRGNVGHILQKERVLGTEVAQKGVLGAYLFIIFTFTCQYDQLVGVRSGRLTKKGGGA